MMDTLLHFTVLPSLACIVMELDEPAFSESSGTTIKSNVLVPEPSPYGNTPLVHQMRPSCSSPVRLWIPTSHCCRRW